MSDSTKPPDEGAPEEPPRKEFIQSFFKRASEFTEELLRENERLRFRILELEERAQAAAAGRSEPPPSSVLKELVTRLESLEEERARILARYQDVEKQNLDFTTRFHEIERENNNLANLYIASFQLHATLDLREVTQTILEILINFVGAKVFAVMLLDGERGVLRALAAEGIDRASVPDVKPGEGPIGRVVSSGKTELLVPADRIHVERGAGAPLLDRPALVAPLRIKDSVVGAIAIWEFLAQKPGIEDVDHELLKLLAAHAATALQGAKLSSEAGSKAEALWRAIDLV